MDRDEMMELYGAMAKVEVKLFSLTSSDSEIKGLIIEAREHQVAANNALRESMHKIRQEA